MSRILLILTLALTTTIVNAQDFLDNLRRKEAGKGTVTVVQSAAIDSLVNGTAKTHQGNGTANTQQTATANTQHNDGTHTDLVAPRQHDDAADHGKENIASSSSSSNDLENTVVDTRKKVMRNSYKMQGYRIQVFSGGNSRTDRQKAESAGAVMKNNFPTEPIYVHFYSPSWKCRMGNYKTVEEARALLAKVKKLGYNQACIVKGTISVAY